MNLASTVAGANTVPNMNAPHDGGTIIELVDHLVAGGQFAQDERQEVLAALQEREDKISTGIGSGVAIPHAFSDSIEEVVAAFGRSVEGVDFEALDNAPVHFIVLFVVQRKEYHLHLKTLAAIAQLFTSREVRQRLNDAVTPEEIHEIFASRPARA